MIKSTKLNQISHSVGPKKKAQVDNFKLKFSLQHKIIDRSREPTSVCELTHQILQHVVLGI